MSDTRTLAKLFTLKVKLDLQDIPGESSGY